MGNLQVFQGDWQNCQHQGSSWLKPNLPAKAKHLMYKTLADLSFMNMEYQEHMHTLYTRKQIKITLTAQISTTE